MNNTLEELNETMNLNSHNDYDDSIDFVELSNTLSEGELIAENSEKVEWTDEQFSAINDRNRNLLVSASAGSGKTAVMTQRIINLIQDGASISKFLIVTFTSASAQDMKTKIIKRLMEIPKTDHVLKQIDAIATSDISDLHSFYSRLVSTYFYEVDVDPSYRIIDKVESDYLKEKAINRLFEKKERDDDEDYFYLYDILQHKRDSSSFKKIIFKMSDYLDCHIDSDKWFKETLSSAYSEDIEQNICAKFIVKKITQDIQVFIEKCEKFAEKSLSFDCKSYYVFFMNLSEKLKIFSEDKSYLEIAKIILNFEFDRICTIKDEKHKFLVEDAQKLNNDVKDFINKNLKKEITTCDSDKIIETLRQAKRNLQLLYDLTMEYSKIYTSLKKEINGLDFNDLEKYSIKILSKSAICDSLKNKYDYIFVDEYQDINSVQEKIISLISSENNRFMVGDLKQSIYDFRYCDPEIFLEKYKTYSKNQDLCNVIKLNRNFRSDVNILKFVDSVFSGVMTEKFGGIDYESESKFTAGSKNTNFLDSTTLCFIDTTVNKNESYVTGETYSVKNHVQEDDEETKAIIAEARYVAKKIAEIASEALSSDSKFKYSDFAILVSSMKSKTIQFIEELRKFGIPISSDEEIDLMEKTYIQEIVNFAKYVTNSKDDFIAFKVLKSRLFGFSDEEIVKIRKINGKSRFYEFTYLINQIRDDSLKCRVIAFYETIEKYKELALIMSIKDFVKKVIKDFKLERLNLFEKDGNNINENMLRFISALPNVSVSEFLVNYKDFSLFVQNKTGGDAVNITTIHKSKGLEYKYVFLINISKNINLDSIKETIIFNKKFGIGFQSYDLVQRIKENTLPLLAIKFYQKQKIIEEQQRVLYVALTRAVRKLFVICSAKEKDLESEFNGLPKSYLDWFSPMIYSELNGNHNDEIIFEHYSIDDFSESKNVEDKQLIFKIEDEPKLSEFTYDYEQSTFVPLKNSVSKILKSSKEDKNIFSSVNNDDKIAKDNSKKDVNLDNSIEFDDLEYLGVYEQDNGIVNSNISSSAQRGTAYHKILQNIDFNNLDNISEQLDALEMKYQDEFKLVDKSVICKVMSLPFFNLVKDYTVIKEREFMAKLPATIINKNALPSDSIILQGVVDLCVIKDDGIYILDYKTGKYSVDKLDGYKFQVSIYADVFERIFNKKVLKKLICFIDEQNIIEF